MRRNKSGQAIAEFVVGLVAILILIAAIIQIGTLVRADTVTMQQARARAGAAALSDVYMAPVSPGPRYMADWEAGPDGNDHTRDDIPVYGNSALLSGGLVANSRPAALEVFAPGNPVSAISESDTVLPGLGFVGGRASSGAIQLYPVMRNLVFGRDSIELESQVYLIWTRGLE